MWGRDYIQGKKKDSEARGYTFTSNTATRIQTLIKTEMGGERERLKIKCSVWKALSEMEIKQIEICAQALRRRCVIISATLRATQRRWLVAR